MKGRSTKQEDKDVLKEVGFIFTIVVMIRINKIVLIGLLLITSQVLFSQQNKKTSTGNPIFPGWYADPEGIIFGKEYWIYPTYSAPYDKQVFMDAFSSTDLINWTKHNRVMDTANVKWAKRAVWAPSVVVKDKKYYLFFGANDIQSNAEKGGIGVAVADKP
jgi:beta-xylosidase